MVALQRSPHVNIKLSVVVPCYNEEKFLRASIERLHATLSNECTLEIVIVDDYSGDGSVKIAEGLAREFPAVQLLKHPENRGKGAALRTGFAKATGDVIAIHDADLEYTPLDLKRMLHFLLENKADVVFGTRFQHREARRVLYFWHTLANQVITIWCNMWTNLNLTDIECCYKMFTRDVLDQLTIEDDRFGVEPELVSKCAHMKIGGRRLRIFEMGVDYHARTYAEGKKIGIKDAVRALWVIAKYNLLK
ncbi:MAG: glycosyltransferase family 2 protein [Alphaproteobacteria bacterium]|nr:glycosyltransferase family 2 protein [Alphaproteobacteria bacterium]